MCHNTDFIGESACFYSSSKGGEDFQNKTDKDNIHFTLWWEFFFAFLTFLRPNFFLSHLDFSRPIN